MKEKRFFKPLGFFGLLVIVFTFPIIFFINDSFSQTTPTYPKVLRFASFSPGTTLYAVSSGLAKVASENTPMTLSVVPTTGVFAWLPMLSKLGTADLGITGLEQVWQIWTGKNAPEPMPKGFPKDPIFPKTRNIRVLIAGPPIPCGMLVRKDSGMKELKDLKGKTIAWGWSGFPNNIGITLANLFLAGLTIDDVKTSTVTEVVSAVKAVQEKRIDSTTCAVGMPAIAEADAMVGVRFLKGPMDPERDKEARRANPGGYTIIVRAGLPGIPEDTPVWGLPLAILVSTNMPDHVAYRLVKTWYENYNAYAPIHPLLKAWTPEVFSYRYITAPYHNGSIQFFKEKGLWNPEMERIQKELLTTE